jgi:hypothetical protein
MKENCQTTSIFVAIKKNDVTLRHTSLSVCIFCVTLNIYQKKSFEHSCKEEWTYILYSLCFSLSSTIIYDYQHCLVILNNINVKSFIFYLFCDESLGNLYCPCGQHQLSVRNMSELVIPHLKTWHIHFVFCMKHRTMDKAQKPCNIISVWLNYLKKNTVILSE